MRSAVDHPDTYLTPELAAGRLAGLSVAPLFLSLHVKPTTPVGGGVKDGISKDIYSLKCVTVDDAFRSLGDLDLGALMAKFDVKATHCNIPTHPDDRFLLSLFSTGRICSHDSKRAHELSNVIG